ncbi:nitroreductase family protein [Desulfogranum mediterraneum]|uniref:nitroreductase family protein n=1 Tax=Desulfogranum mediterraneum TaxID=160661 RepID=UPI000427E6A3|nr:nitroreductase family protein [Desulfogranum mediterraneum]
MELQLKELQLEIDQDSCIQCRACVQDCPYAILELAPDYPAVIPDRAEQCIECQHCLAVCPTGALSILGFEPEGSLPLKGIFPTEEQLSGLIRGRRSVRRYKATPLEPEVIDAMLATVAHAPTGVNNCQCLFSVVEDQEVMKRIREQTIAGIRAKAESESLPSGLEFFAGIVRAWDEGNDILFRGAPHLLLVSTPKQGPSPQVDPIIALSYFELLAASMKLGTLWNGLAKWAFMDIVPEMLPRLGIPEDHSLGYLMLFGQPAVQYFRTVQRAPGNVRRVVF